MTPWSDDNLERLLRTHLTCALDPQLGRAEPHFRRKLAVLHWWRTRTAGLGVLAAMAACAALAWNLWPTIPAPRPDNGILAVATPSAQPVRVDQLTCWRTLDEGTVFLDDQTPMRRIRRQVIETYEWFDPQQQAKVEITVPREEVILVTVQTY